MDLSKLGLNLKEAKIYITLLKDGPNLANKISKLTGILRSSIYDYLDLLLKNGFISYTLKSSKRYFKAVDPERLMDRFNENKKKEETELKKLIPKLNVFKNKIKRAFNVEIFEGQGGIKTAMDSILKDKPKIVFVFGSSRASVTIMPAYIQYWHKRRGKLKIFLQIIYAKNILLNDRIEKNPGIKRYAEIRTSPFKADSIVSTLIYENKVIIVMWSKETSLAIRIESQDMADSYKDNFNVLWKTSTQYKP